VALICPSIGIATSATIVAVKVLSDSGSGSYSDIISRVDWAYSQFQASPTPSVVIVSFGGAPSTSVDSAVSTVSLFMHLTVPFEHIWL
jgi:cerevisin